MRKNCVFTLIWCKVRCCLCDHRRFFEHLKSFFFSLLKLPLWWMLYSCTSGVGTMPSWCVCWSELSGERLCWLSTISQSVFMCVRWSISLLTLVSQAPTQRSFSKCWPTFGMLSWFHRSSCDSGCSFPFHCKTESCQSFLSSLYTHTLYAYVCLVAHYPVSAGVTATVIFIWP